MNAELDPEDAKIITLARGARARAGAESGAAVRDETGRTYAAVDVSLTAVSVSALELAVLTAVSSGATRLEAAAVVSSAAGDPDSIEGTLDAAWELDAVRVLLAGPDGALAQVYLNPGKVTSV
ncbi:MAG TPA: cytidine deaminase [Actinospica sp.]|jgi:hypothetical protein|nr:cytidine deaminase [Actinospica sp.]